MERMEQEWMKQFKKRTRRLRSLEKKMEECAEEKVVDSVSGSSVDFPYIRQRFRIEGIDVNRLERLRKRYERERSSWNEEIEILEQYIAGLPDPLDQEIVELYALDDLTWKKIGEQLGFSESAVFKRYQKLFR